MASSKAFLPTGTARKGIFSALALCMLAPPVSWADSGTIEIVQSAVNTLLTTQIGDMTVAARGGPAITTITRVSGDGPFVEGASGSGKCTSFSKKSASSFDLEAYCSAAFSAQDSFTMAFRRKSGDVVVGSSGQGVEQIGNGTGRFAGVTGECTYSVNMLPEAWAVTVSKCKWSK